ncbi:Ig-like domain repeat protein [Planctomycetota bacterium]
MRDLSFGDYTAILEYKKVDNPEGWQSIFSDRPVGGEFGWRTPLQPGLYILRLTLKNQHGLTLQAESNGPFYIGSVNVRAIARRAYMNTRSKVVLNYELEGLGKTLVSKIKVWLWKNETGSWDIHKIYEGQPEKIEFDLGDGSYGFALTADTRQNINEPRPVTVKDVEAHLVIRRQTPSYRVAPLLECYTAGQSAEVKITSDDKFFDLVKVELTTNGQNPVTFTNKGGDQSMSIPLNKLPDGPFELTVFIKDDFREIYTLVAESYFDTTPPIANTMTPYLFTAEKKAVIDYDIKEDGCGVAIRELLLYDRNNNLLDTHLFESDRGNLELDLEEGSYRFRFRVADKLGNTFETPELKAHILIIDRTPPVIKLLTQQTDRMHDTTKPVLIRWAADDANFGRGPISIFYSADGGLDWRPVISHIANTGVFDTWAPPNVKNGSFIIKVVAKDLAGLTAEVVSPGKIRVNVDGAMVVATGPIFSQNREVAIQYRVSDAVSGPFKAVELWYRPATGGEWRRWPKDLKNDDTPFIWEAPADGEYGIFLRGIDENGKGDSPPGLKTSAQLIITVDTRPPLIIVTSINAGNVYRGGAEDILSWTAKAEQILPKSIAIQFRTFHGGRWRTLATNLAAHGNFKWTVPRINSDTAVVRITAKDLSGNVFVLNSRSFAIDSAPPSFLLIVDERTTTDKISLKFRIKDKYSKSVKNVTVFGSDDNGNSWIKIADNAMSPVLWPPPVDGKYSFFAIGTDEAGNRNSNPGPGTIPLAATMVDRDAPFVRLKNFTGGDRVYFAAGTTHYLMWNAHDPNLLGNSIRIFFSSDNGNSWKPVAETSMPNTGSYLWKIPGDKAIGPRTPCKIKITAEDTHDHTGEAISAKPFFIDGVAPTFEIIKKPSDLVQKRAVFELQIDDGQGSGVGRTFLKYRSKGALNWHDYDRQEEEDPAMISFSELDGEYELYFVCTDRAGNYTTQPTIRSAPHGHVKIDSTPPKIIITDLANNELFRIGETRDIKWQALDPNMLAGSVKLSLEYQQDGQMVNNVLAAGQEAKGSYPLSLQKIIARADEGQEFKLTIEASDLLGNTGTSTVSLFVDDAPPILAVSHVDGPIDGKITLDIDGSDGFSGLKNITFWVQRGKESWREVKVMDKPGSMIYTFPGDGAYNFYAVGEDMVGNHSRLPTDKTVKPMYSFLYDTHIPEITFGNFPTYVINPFDVLPVMISVHDQSGLTSESLKFTYSSDEQATWKELDRVYDVNFLPLKDRITTEITAKLRLADESHERLFLRADISDPAGNVGSAVSKAFIVDSKAPQAEASKVTVLDDGNLLVEYNSSDPGFAGVVEIEIWTKIGEDEWQKYGETHDEIGKPIKIKLPHGNYMLSLVAVDAAGNREPQPRGNDKLYNELDFEARPPLPNILIAPARWTSVLKGNHEIKLTWDTHGDYVRPNTICIQFTSDNGKNWQVIEENLENTGILFWHLPVITSEACRFRFTVKDTFGQIGIIETESFDIDSQGDGVELVFPGDENKNGTEEKTSGGGTVENDPDQEKDPNDNQYEQPNREDEHKPATTDPAEMTLDELLYMGRLKFRQGEFNTAKNFFQYALKIDKRNAESHGYMGRIYARKKNTAKAREYFELAVKYKSVDHAVFMDYGVIKYTMSQFVEARKLFTAAVANYHGKDSHEKARILFNLGACDFVLRNHRNAVSSFKASYNNNSSNRRCVLYLAKSYTELFKADPKNESDKDNAKHYWTKVIELYTLESKEGRDALEKIDELNAIVTDE